MILSKYRLRGCPFRAELSIARKVRLVALIEVIAVGQNVFVRQFVIKTSGRVPEVIRVCDWDSNCSDWYRDSIDARRGHILVICNARVEVLKTCQGRQHRLAALLRLPGAWWQPSKLCIACRRRNRCCNSITRLRGFAPRIFFQQSEKECSVRKDRPASVGAELIHTKTGRMVYLSALICQTNRFHPVSPVVLPQLSMQLVRSALCH